MTDKNKVFEKAVEVLKEGGILLYPTDTIWGIGCDATNDDAVARIFEMKNRNDSKSLIILASDMDMVARYVKEIPEMAYTLVEISEKPVTIIYPEGVDLAENVTAEDGSIAIRIPKSDFCIELLKRFGRPIVSTSANVSDKPSPKKFVDISEDIKSSVDYVIDCCMEKGATHKASSIIKLGLHNEVQVIRE